MRMVLSKAPTAVDLQRSRKFGNVGLSPMAGQLCERFRILQRNDQCGVHIRFITG